MILVLLFEVPWDLLGHGMLGQQSTSELYPQPLP
jgi:hypothetical protein